MAEFRRLRTQDDRATDDHVWRETAASRPGYATWPDTRAGDPSWWRRGEPVDPDIWMTTENINDATPPPVDGETCKQWCGYCHLGSGLAEISADMNAAFDRVEEMRAAIVEAGETGRPVTLPNGDVITPRRRWWHRYTRRNP